MNKRHVSTLNPIVVSSIWKEHSRLVVMMICTFRRYDNTCKRCHAEVSKGKSWNLTGNIRKITFLWNARRTRGSQRTARNNSSTFLMSSSFQDARRYALDRTTWPTQLNWSHCLSQFRRISQHGLSWSKQVMLQSCCFCVERQIYSTKKLDRSFKRITQQLIFKLGLALWKFFGAEPFRFFVV